ncbi:hypothetical protein ACSSZE_07410 [Acidithiobacillus caldus]
MSGKEIRRWICAALLFEGGPATVVRLAQLIPGHPEPHHVSQQVYELKKAGLVEKIGVGAGGKPTWRLQDRFVSTNEITEMIPQIERAAREKVALYSDRDAVRTEILECLREPAPPAGQKPVLSKQEILSRCRSAVSEHEVSQILAELVADGRLIAEGSGAKRRYWAAKNMQLSLCSLIQIPEVPIFQDEKTIRARFAEGKAARRRSAIGGAVTATFDRRGNCLELVINKEFLNGR